MQGEVAIGRVSTRRPPTRHAGTCTQSRGVSRAGRIGGLLALVALTLLPARVTRAGAVGVTGKVGTLGLGGEVTVPLVPASLNIRAGYNWFSYDDTVKLDEAHVDGTIDLQTIPILLDWHPARTGFRISGGPVINNNEVAMSARDKVLILDDVAFQVQSLDGAITFDNLGAYLGIGYGNATADDGRWHFACDFGVMYHGEPQVEASAQAPIPGAYQELLNQALDDEVAELQDDLKNFVVYPVIALGVSVNF
ncbi:MAG: hypothetical protein K8T26_02635 [Lentisphaerae bacterium]|nr:hypothetical protein [Lentisphaerota bacterium]